MSETMNILLWNNWPTTSTWNDTPCYPLDLPLQAIRYFIAFVAVLFFIIRHFSSYEIMFYFQAVGRRLFRCHWEVPDPTIRSQRQCQCVACCYISLKTAHLTKGHPFGKNVLFFCGSEEKKIETKTKKWWNGTCLANAQKLSTARIFRTCESCVRPSVSLYHHFRFALD